MDIFISNLLSKSIFNFGKWSNWKYANTHISVFSVWPLPKVKNWFRKQIWNENVHVSILIFFGAFRQYLKKKSKIGFPLYFQNVIWRGGGLNLLPKKILKKPKNPQICPSFGGNVGETLFRHRPIIPLPYLGQSIITI